MGRDDLATVGAELAFDRAYGSFDQNGRFQTLREAEADDLVASLAAGIRLWPQRLQVYGRVPLRYQYRKLYGLGGEQHVGLGDSSLALRVTVVDGARQAPTFSECGTLLPQVDVFLGMRFKTGRGPNDARKGSLVDATGDGSNMAYFGASMAELFTRDQGVTLSSSYGYRFRRTVQTPMGLQRFNPGNEVLARAAFFYNLSLFWSLEFSLAWRSSASSTYDDTTAQGSSTRRVRAGLSVTRTLRFPSWQLALAATADPPIRGLGKNVALSGSTLSFSVRRNFKGP